MKAINIIGLLLIVLTSTIGNRIAPGQYCAGFQRDTVWAFGQTKGAENDKHGFWVIFNKWHYLDNLGAVGHFVDNKQDGAWITFNCDSLQTKESEAHYINGNLSGLWMLYNSDGSLKCKIQYADDKIVDGWWCDNNSMVVVGNKIAPMEYIMLDNMEGDKYVVFNSWTNNITTINVVICCILLVLNVVSIARERKI
ncbi:MAG: hypothetical protein II075_02125 [Bacteroidales bacterium]|nr:hypothetical protein [Bacteroidales bacterium]